MSTALRLTRRAARRGRALPQELGDKFAWTVRLHNGLAACQMRMGRWEDAEGELLQVRRAHQGSLVGWLCGC